VVSAALLALACALLCAPRRVAAARLSALQPRHGRARRRRLRAGGPVALGAVAGLLAAGPGGALAGLLVAVTISRGRAGRAAEAAEAAGAAELADALRRITDELRAGSHPASALAGLIADGPIAGKLLAPAATAARLGDDVPAALRRSAAAHVSAGAELERVATAWSLAERHGVPLAELLAGVHDDIHWRVRFGAGVRAQLAGPRATAGVLTALPALGVALGQLMGADPIGVLRGGVLGQILLVIGIGLVAAGRAWTAQILRRAVPQ
jgi:tight adherence protein B